MPGPSPKLRQRGPHSSKGTHGRGGRQARKPCASHGDPRGESSRHCHQRRHTRKIRAQPRCAQQPQACSSGSGPTQRLQPPASPAHTSRVSSPSRWQRLNSREQSLAWQRRLGFLSRGKSHVCRPCYISPTGARPAATHAQGLQPFPRPGHPGLSQGPPHHGLAPRPTPLPLLFALSKERAPTRHK